MNVRIPSLGLAALVALLPAFASALPGTFHIDALYSNADGSVQYVEIRDHGASDCDASENLWSGQQMRFRSAAGTWTTYTFAANLPTCATSGKRILIGSTGFAALGVVTPDYVMPNGSLSTTSGAVNFADVAFLEYSSLPLDGVSELGETGATVPAVATNLAGASHAFTTAPTGAATNYEGMWWASPAESESGWGINFAHQGDTIFATWFTFGSDGDPTWFVVGAERTAPGVYSGTPYTVAGSPYNVAWDPAKLGGSAVGSVTLTFTDADHAQFAFTINGQARVKAITREVFAQPQPICTWNSGSSLESATNYQDMWWAAGGTESGWGINFAHQGDIIFATWFTFGLDGKPTWFVVGANKTAPGVYTGTPYTVRGSPYSAVWDPSKLQGDPVGSATLTFADGAHAVFAFTINGHSGSKNLEREIFAPPGTRCQ